MLKPRHHAEGGAAYYVPRLLVASASPGFRSLGVTCCLCPLVTAVPAPTGTTPGTNCSISHGYSTSPPLPVTRPLSSLSMADVVVSGAAGVVHSRAKVAPALRSCNSTFLLRRLDGLPRSLLSFLLGPEDPS